jgi:hypothetical protein
MPGSGLFGALGNLGETFVSPVETLSNILNEAGASREVVDGRVHENLRVIVTEAEQVIKGRIPLATWLLVGGTALCALLVLMSLGLSVSLQSGLMALFAFIFAIGLMNLGLWSFFGISGYVRRRRFCQTVLCVFGPEAPAAPRFH